jgi:tetratricopeptide (TPR) repeat protein
VNLPRPSTRALVAAGAAIVLLLGAAAGAWYWHDAQQRRAGTAYADVMTRVWAAQGPQGAPDLRAQAQQDLERVMAQYPSASGVAEAALELGNLRYAAQQYAQARGAYEVAVARASSPTVRTLARTSIGYTWEAERDFAKAIDAYQSVARALGPKDFLWEQAHFDLARAQELGGKRTEAAATYQKILKDAVATPRADDARRELTRLGAKPEK